MKAGGPFLRWIGGKQWFAETEIFENFSTGRARVVDPFLGAGSLVLSFLSVPNRSALVGDRCEELINAWCMVTQDPRAVASALARFPGGRDGYYWVRSLIGVEPTLRAARFVYLNKRCFGGIYRTNTQGRFNVPYCGEDRALPSETDLVDFAARFNRIELKESSFQNFKVRFRPTDLLILDPPYVSSLRERQSYDRYTYPKFDRSDVKKVESLARKAASKNVSVLVFAAEDDLLAELLSDWKVLAERKSRSGQGFLTRAELVFSNP
jgi:DNA adenine methylase